MGPRLSDLLKADQLAPLKLAVPTRGVEILQDTASHLILNGNVCESLKTWGGEKEHTSTTPGQARGYFRIFCQEEIFIENNAYFGEFTCSPQEQPP